jgi:hypothetical protein
VTVHDVDVDQPRAGVDDLAHLRSKPREVGGQDRGSNANPTVELTPRDRVFGGRFHQTGFSIELRQC